MLTITTIPVTVFSQNARVISCAQSHQAVIVDPGGEPERIIELIDDGGLTCTGIWLTHSHLDHCAGVAHLLEVYQVPLIGHQVEAPMRANVSTIAGMYGLPEKEWPNCPEPTVFVKGGETLRVGELSVGVLFTPGHSPGHVSFYCADENIVISGDALFQGSIGRTDLPGGDHGLLIQSIRSKLLTLPDDTRVLSGHGPDTTIGAERSSNPFVGSQFSA